MGEGVVPEKMTWFGTLKVGKGREITLKAICTAGLDSHIGSLQDGIPVDGITGKDVSLVIETEEYNGKHIQKSNG